MKRLLLLVLLMFSVITTSQAGGIDKKKLPSLLAGSNAGNEFFVSFPPVYEEVAGGDNSLRIFVASGVRQEVTISIPGKGVKLTKVTVPNDVIEFRISPGDGLPYSKPIKCNGTSGASVSAIGIANQSKSTDCGLWCGQISVYF